MFQPYKNLSGNSPVKSFKKGDDFITVIFKERSKSGRDTYTYTYRSAGSLSIEEMKRLADDGRGLAGYIVQNVRKSYEPIT